MAVFTVADTSQALKKQELSCDIDCLQGNIRTVTQRIPSILTTLAGNRQGEPSYSFTYSKVEGFVK